MGNGIEQMPGGGLSEEQPSQAQVGVPNNDRLTVDGFGVAEWPEADETTEVRTTIAVLKIVTDKDIEEQMEEILKADRNLGDTVEAMTRIVAHPYDLARHIGGFVFKELAAGSAFVTQYKVDQLRHSRFYNQPDEVSYRKDLNRFVGARGLSYGLAAYQAFTAGPRNSLAKRYGLSLSERS